MICLKHIYLCNIFNNIYRKYKNILNSERSEGQ